jgi:hypothetical protein
MSKKVWSSTITTDMVKGWDSDKVNDLVDNLNDAVERVFTDFESEE